MELKLTRTRKTPTFTGGTLTIGDESFFTCEDAERPVKVAGETAIPKGRYKVVITFSQRFQKHLPLLLDVPNFTGIRIHAGNDHTMTQGCVLLGLTELYNGVGDSRRAMTKFMPLLRSALKEGDVWLSIS
jgi:hypothetical protein